MEYRIGYYRKEQDVFPEKLRQIPYAPKGVYVKGKLPEVSSPSVAIVGARYCSAYGKSQAYEFARVLAQAGVTIISGLARGVDSHAHRGALDGQGKTYAVMGCGLDQIYPPEHRGLAEQMIQSGGGLISEYPICTPPLPAYFPQRNRIISGLADVILVVEAKIKSGSLITTDWALEQGKTVYALPGRVGDALSLGCNRLIAQGAGIAYSPECILQELHIEQYENKNGKLSNEKESEKQKNNFGLASDLKLVYSVLSFEHQSLDAIVEKTGLPVSKVMELVLRLELDGRIAQEGKNNYVKI